MQGKKRKLDPPRDKQTPRVSRWILTNLFLIVILTLSLLLSGPQRQQEHENDELKQETKNDEEVGWEEKAIRQLK